jgi:ketosteroid isomerase-like protein
MSENLDLVRSIWANWERGDFSSVEWADPEIEFSYQYGVEPGTAKGLRGMGERWGQTLSAFEGLRARADEYRELDRERVLVLYHFSGRGKASGVEVAQTLTQGACLFRVRKGKVAKLVIYFDRDRALADLGLKE